MKLTAKGRYAVRALFDIAYHSSGLETQGRDISSRQRISPRYLEQVFQMLKRAGIVDSRRGPHGGYWLLKEPRQISIYDVLAATEGPMELLFCASDERDDRKCEPPPRRLQKQSPDGRLWEGVGEDLAGVFRETTIQDLCDRAQQVGVDRCLDSRFMYFI